MGTIKNNKPVYVNKYDYMHYYTRCEPVWFLTNAEIKDVINNQITDLKNKDKIEEIADDKEFFEKEINSNDDWRQNQLNGKNNTSPTQGDNDPQLIEGKLVDKLARNFISSKYHVDVVIDYDDDKYKDIRFDNEKAALQTKNDIDTLKKNKKTFILFQPTFINQTVHGSKYVTKCDCIIYLNSNECYLVEVKGSSRSKLINFLDLLFQKFILENSYLKVNNYLLCLIKCQRGQKDQIPFIIDEYINLDKHESKPKKEDLSKIQNISILCQKETDFLKLKEEYKTGKHAGISITDALNIVFNESLLNKSEFRESRISSKILDKCTPFLNLGKTFYDVIDEIAKIKMIKEKISDLVPCDKCNSAYRDCQFKDQCKELFKAKYLNNVHEYQEYFPYDFSGDVFKSQFKAYNEIKEHPIDVNNFNTFKSLISNSYVDLFDGKKFTIDETKLKILWDELQSVSHRVYFDFESIDPAIPPLDGAIPLNHTVTQNSIIKTKNYYEIESVENMIIDPQKISIEWLKSIVDKLYDPNSMIYIVYNKAFESARLQDMDYIIKDPDYHKKIEYIRNHIFDLKDFFKNNQQKFPTKKNSENTQVFPPTTPILSRTLKGYYTIKKLINELVPSSILKSVDCLRYDDPKLQEIHKGDVAKNTTMLRYLSLYSNEASITDEDWKETEAALKIYCENDVRGMIAVEKYIKQEFIDKMPKE